MKVYRSIFCSFFLLLISSLLFSQNSTSIDLTYEPALPPVANDNVSLGYAGMMGGVQDNIVIAAGGANFPAGETWEGGTKEWYDSIYYLENGTWTLSKKTLPLPLAYGASVSIPGGILFIGGNNKNHISNEVFQVSFNKSKKEIELEYYPNLPEPLAYTNAVYTDGYVYVAGGMNAETSSNSFYRINLENKDHWEKLQDFPGEPRAVHSMAVQETSTSKSIFLIGGRNQKKDEVSTHLTNFLSYDIKKGQWKNEGDLVLNGSKKVIMGASAEPSGSMHILVYGGSDEVLFKQLESLAIEIETAKNDSIAQYLTKKKNQILINHPGFSNEVLAYNTMTNN